MNALAQVVNHSDQIHDSRRVEAFEIGAAMKVRGLPMQFIAQAVDFSGQFDGIWELMRMWRDDDDQKEREVTIADIQELIDDCSQRTNFWRHPGSSHVLRCREFCDRFCR